MYNPFLKDGYLMPVVSINKFNFISNLVSLKGLQRNGIGVLGYNLGRLLLALKEGGEENRRARADWRDSHWTHWRQVEEIFLGGGITAEPLGSELLLHIARAFKESGNTPYKITIPQNSELLPLIGAAKIAAGQCEDKDGAMVFDFGQSYVKRGYLHAADPGDAQGKREIKVLEKIEARHVQLDYEEGERNKEEAEKLDAFIQNVITESCLETFPRRKTESVIVLGIANYVHKGTIAGSRGGYGKLCLIADNYEAYLSAKIGGALNIPVKIVLAHDGMAAAAMFNELEKSYALISLGTYMGVGFPTPIYKKSRFSYTLVP